MENGVEPLITEMFAPIEGGEILGHHIAVESGQIPEIARSEIVDHGESRIGQYLLKGEGQVRADKAGSPGNDKVKKRIRQRHGKEMVGND